MDLVNSAISKFEYLKMTKVDETLIMVTETFM